MLCYVTLRYVILRYVTLRYAGFVMLRYIMIVRGVFSTVIKNVRKIVHQIVPYVAT